MDLIGLLLLLAVGYGLYRMVSGAGRSVGALVSAGAEYRNTARQLAHMRKVHSGLQALWRADDWVAVDTETTGLGEGAVVIEIAVRAKDRTLLLNERVALPKGARLSAKAVELHGITREALGGALSWPEVRQRFEAAVQGKRLLAYNAEFDERMVRQTDRAHELPAYEGRWLDLMESYSLLWGERWKDSGKLKMQRLPGGRHSAESDTLALVALLERIAKSDPP